MQGCPILVRSLRKGGIHGPGHVWASGGTTARTPTGSSGKDETEDQIQGVTSWHNQHYAPTIVNRGITRSIFRWIHIIFSIPILGYIYSPFEKLPESPPQSGSSSSL